MSFAAAVGSLIVPFTTVHAQNLVPVYQVPFAFNAEGVELAPGNYTVSQTGLNSATLKRNHKPGIMFITGHHADKAGTSRLTFNRYGNRYFLRQVCDENGTVSKIPVSSQEREILQNQDTAKAAPTAVAIIAQR
jgi:hypothetical protein